MKPLTNWIVCLDLTKMDEAVIGYVNFFSKLVKPHKITFLHVIETYDVFQDLIDDFPELETEEDLNEILVKQINTLIESKLTDSVAEVDVVIRKGSATNQIIKMMDNQNPDLLVLGKKAGFKGEGILAQRIVKYVPCSILYVPETARYSIENITVPIDFSEQAVQAVRSALELVKPAGGQVTAQHLFDYPKQFFPYMPDKNTIAKIDKELAEKKKDFLNLIKTPGDTDFEIELTLHKDGKMSDDIYDLCISLKTDMVVVFSKARSNMLAFMSDKLPERMAKYNFGIPLLILKNKERNQKLFKTFLKS
ncbi:MAG: universal stress protein [Balneolales bacterium]|nr:universal stress protein [Balneolales bacterium]